MKTTKRPKPWTALQDTLLRKAAQDFGNCWIQVAEHLGRDAHACRLRFEVLEPSSAKTEQPLKLRRSPRKKASAKRATALSKPPGSPSSKSKAATSTTSDQMFLLPAPDAAKPAKKPSKKTNMSKKATPSGGSRKANIQDDPFLLLPTQQSNMPNYIMPNAGQFNSSMVNPNPFLDMSQTFAHSEIDALFSMPPVDEIDWSLPTLISTTSPILFLDAEQLPTNKPLEQPEKTVISGLPQSFNHAGTTRISQVPQNPWSWAASMPLVDTLKMTLPDPNDNLWSLDEPLNNALNIDSTWNLDGIVGDLANCPKPHEDIAPVGANPFFDMAEYDISVADTLMSSPCSYRDESEDDTDDDGRPQDITRTLF